MVNRTGEIASVACRALWDSSACEFILQSLRSGVHECLHERIERRCSIIRLQGSAAKDRLTKC
jgi:hypothetical protein